MQRTTHESLRGRSLRGELRWDAPHRDVSLQPLENKVLSWGIIGESAPLLAEITIRKSQYVIFGLLILLMPML